MKKSIFSLWFKDFNADKILINETAVRIRAGILILIPIFLSYTLYNAVFCGGWVVDTNTLKDTFETDFDEHIIYSAEVVRKSKDYSIQTYVLLFGFFEMIFSMSKYLSYLSPTIWISTILARGKEPVWKPLTPKRYAWTIGATFIAICLVFFNPEVPAHYINMIFHKEILSESKQYLSYYIPITLIWICFGFMWMETVLGFCAGCSLHALLVKIGILKEECIECGDINSKEAQKAKEKYYNSINK